jgi:NADH:ubiquinone oxidoreductase subunit 6 (subunit J)
MALHLILLGLLVVFMLLAIFLTDLLRAAVALAVGSAVLSILFFIYGVPYAAVFELSVGAGLVMVLFASTIGLTRRGNAENEEKGKSSVLLLPLLILLALAVIDISIFALMNQQVLVVRNTAPAANFGDMLWRVRWLDILGQLAIIVVGVFAVLGLFRKDGALFGGNPNGDRPDEEETHGS